MTTKSQAVIEEVRALLDWVDHYRDTVDFSQAENALTKVSGRIGSLLDRVETADSNWLEDDTWRQDMEARFRKQEQNIKFYQGALVAHFAECEEELVPYHIKVLAEQARTLGVRLVLEEDKEKVEDPDEW